MVDVGAVEKHMVMVVPRLLLEVVKQVGAGLEQFTLDQTPTTPIPVNCEFCMAVEVVETVPVVVTLVILGLPPVPVASSL